PRQLRRYAAGQRPTRLNPSTRRAMRRYLAGHVRDGDRVLREARAPYNGDSELAAAVAEVEAAGGMTEVERYYLEALRRIEGMEASESMRIMARDSLASSLSRLAGIIADRAAEARARAIEKAESASESRAKAIERAEEAADARVRS